MDVASSKMSNVPSAFERKDEMVMMPILFIIPSRPTIVCFFQNPLP